MTASCRSHVMAPLVSPRSRSPHQVQGDPARFDPYGANPNRKGSAVPQVSVNRSAPMAFGYTDQLSVGIQRQLGRDLGMSADLVRALGNRLPVGWDLNYPDPITGVRPDPAYRQILVTESIGQSWYTALQVGVRKRLSHRYTYEHRVHVVVIGKQHRWTRRVSAGSDESPGRPRSESERCRHQFIGSTTVELPFECRLAAVVTARSALPYNVTTGVDNNKDGVINDRPPEVGRDSARGTAAFDADVRFSKMIRVGSSRFELLAEVFNATNQANWTDYQGDQMRPTTFGQPTSAGPPRQLQIGLRFDF